MRLSAGPLGAGFAALSTGLAALAGLGAHALASGNVPTQFPPLAYAALSCEPRPVPSPGPGGVVTAASPQCASVGRIFIEAGDESGPRRLTNPPFTNEGPGSGVIDRAPSWSGRGQLAFERQERSRDSRIMVVGEDGSGERPIAIGREPDWSPDATSLAFWRVIGCPRACRGQLVLARADGSHTRRLTPTAYDAQSPAFSPDGKAVAYVRNLSRGRFELYVVRLFDRRSVRITNTRQDEFSPSWSPDGKRIVFAREIRTGKRALFTLSSRGGRSRPVLPAGPDDADPSWGRAGIAFSRRLSTGRAIYVMSPNGTRIRRLTYLPSQHAVEPAWRGGR